MALVSSHFRQLADDGLVWKALLFRHFGSAQEEDSSPGHSQDRPWKQLYRLQTNWKDGAVSSSFILRHALLPAPPPARLLLDRAEPARAHDEPDSSATAVSPAKSIVQFLGSYFFTANRTPLHSVPSISIHRLSASDSESNASTELTSIQPPSLVAYHTERPHFLNTSPLSITELRLDEGQHALSAANRACPPESVRLAVFYSSGQYVLLRIKLPSDSKTNNSDAVDVVEEYAHLDMAQPDLSARPDPVTTARYHLPLLVTVTERFVLRIHHVVLNKHTGDFDVVLNQASLAASTAVCWRPLTLDLQRKSKSQFRAILVFSSPWFPDSFTISVQEFKLTLPSSSSSSTSSDAADVAAGQLHIQSQAATAVPLSGGGWSTAASRPLITGLDLHNDFVVASREDNTIDLFELVRPTPTRPLRLEHRRRLFSHTCAVHSVSFDGRRCVSGARDGSLKVWHLSQTAHQHRRHRLMPGRQRVNKGRKAASKSSSLPSFQEVVAVKEPALGEFEELRWEEQWSTNAAVGAVGGWHFSLLLFLPLVSDHSLTNCQKSEWVDFDSDKIVLSTPEKIKVLSFA